MNFIYNQFDIIYFLLHIELTNEYSALRINQISIVTEGHFAFPKYLNPSKVI